MRERRRNKRTRARKRLFRMYVEQQAGELSPFSILIRFPLSLVSCFFCPFIRFSLSRFSFRFSSEVAKERQERVPVSQYLDRRSRTCPYPEIRSTRDHSGPPSTRAPLPRAHLRKIDRDILSRERTRVHGTFRKPQKCIRRARGNLIFKAHKYVELKEKEAENLFVKKNYTIIKPRSNYRSHKKIRVNKIITQRNIHS